MYLAAAGIGHIVIADGDSVEMSNLNRQILHNTSDVGRPKAASAKEKLLALNPDIKVDAVLEKLGPENAIDHFEQSDVILDCTDGFPSKYLLNDAAVLTSKPLVHAGVLGFNGQVMVIIPGQSACLRCLFPEPPPEGEVPTCAEAGVMGVVTASIGTIQAAETIKLIADKGTLLTDRMLTFDALDMRWMEMAVKKSPKCPICGENPTITELKETSLRCEVE